MNLKIEDLDSFKLVNNEYVANLAQTQQIIENACLQGSQGWGVTMDDAVLLRLISELRDALVVANASDENARLLKGAQLELGRVKKQRNELKKLLDAAQLRREAGNLGLDTAA